MDTDKGACIGLVIGALIGAYSYYYCRKHILKQYNQFDEVFGFTIAIGMCSVQGAFLGKGLHYVLNYSSLS